MGCLEEVEGEGKRGRVSGTGGVSSMFEFETQSLDPNPLFFPHLPLFPPLFPLPFPPRQAQDAQRHLIANDNEAQFGDMSNHVEAFHLEDGGEARGHLYGDRMLHNEDVEVGSGEEDVALRA